MNRVYLIVLFLLVFICACTEKNTVYSEEYSSEDTVEIIPVFPDYESRAKVSDILTEFYVSAYSGSAMRAKNVKYLYDGTAWKASSVISWPGKNTKISFWALSQPFANADSISDLVFKSSDQNFVYGIDSVKPKNLIFGSYLNTTKAISGGSVRISFYGALAYPTFKCKQLVTDATLIIDEIIVHNLRTSGKFTYNKTKSSAGTWANGNDYYGSFSQKLKTPVSLPYHASKSTTITDTCWTWIPQAPVKWATTATNPVPISEADAKHQSYVEFKCKISLNGSYVWGGTSAAEFESIYFPFSTNFKSTTYKTAIVLNFKQGAVFFADGTPWEPRSGDEFTLAEWRNATVDVDPWEEEEPEDLNF